jgi:hypothetical protein
VSVLDILYRGALAERARRHRFDQPCRTTMLVCLPTGAARSTAEVVHEVRQRLAGRAHTAGAVLDHTHFRVWRRPDPLEQPLLVGPRGRSNSGTPTTCAGAPIGLLDLTMTAQRLAPIAVTGHDTWSRTVPGTPAATPWWAFLGRHRHRPRRYPLAQALRDFAAQPQIAAMLRHDAAAPPGRRFDADCYGPGLSALHTGARAYGDYLTGVLCYGGGLLTVDGDLLTPSSTDVLVEQSLSARTAYHQQARRHLAALHPATVVAAVLCHR